MKKSTTQKRILYGTLCVLWMSLIFWFSAQPAIASQGMSDSIITMLQNLLRLQLSQDTLLWELVSFVIRKAAHMSEYAILAILIYLFLQSGKQQHTRVWALLLTTLYACTDDLINCL